MSAARRALREVDDARTPDVLRAAQGFRGRRRRRRSGPAPHGVPPLGARRPPRPRAERRHASQVVHGHRALRSVQVCIARRAHGWHGRARAARALGPAGRGQTGPDHVAYDALHGRGRRARRSHRHHVARQAPVRGLFPFPKSAIRRGLPRRLRARAGVGREVAHEVRRSYSGDVAGRPTRADAGETQDRGADVRGHVTARERRHVRDVLPRPRR
mmetsp:Transcript_23355/g.72155  ORF Transcript_23355/g.72155 Transcript_23355/m.72155 type:complete len:215 (+) Transcript_23355:2059-2703(+)